MQCIKGPIRLLRVKYARLPKTVGARASITSAHRHAYEAWQVEPYDVVNRVVTPRHPNH